MEGKTDIGNSFTWSQKQKKKEEQQCYQDE